MCIRKVAVAETIFSTFCGASTLVAASSASYCERTTSRFSKPFKTYQAYCGLSVMATSAYCGSDRRLAIVGVEHHAHVVDAVQQNLYTHKSAVSTGDKAILFCPFLLS